MLVICCVYKSAPCVFTTYCLYLKCFYSYTVDAKQIIAMSTSLSLHFLDHQLQFKWNRQNDLMMGHLHYDGMYLIFTHVRRIFITRKIAERHPVVVASLFLPQRLLQHCHSHSRSDLHFPPHLLVLALVLVRLRRPPRGRR